MGRLSHWVEKFSFLELIGAVLSRVTLHTLIPASHRAPRTH